MTEEASKMQLVHILISRQLEIKQKTFKNYKNAFGDQKSHF